MIRVIKETLPKNCVLPHLFCFDCLPVRDLLALDESRCKLKNPNKQIFYHVCAITFLPCQFHSLFLYLEQETFLTYAGKELKTKRI